VKVGPEYDIHIPLDQDKAVEAERRVSDYQEKREKENKLEEEELAQRNKHNTHFQFDQVQGDENQINETRHPKSRSNVSAIQAATEIVGFLPKRGDFDQEYDMDAELLLADMEFFEEDTEENIKLKNSVIELYNARLDERIRRKKFVIERGLLDLKRQQRYERKRTKEERDIINSMKIFARFNTEEDHQKIVNNLIKERMLREVIEQLKYFRSKGLTSLDQIEKFIDSQRKGNAGLQVKKSE